MVRVVSSVINKIKEMAAPALMGLGAQFVPDMAKGLIIEYIGKVPIDELIAYIEKNESLWDRLEPKHQAMAKKMASSLDDLSWLTAEWAINAIKEENPKIASLFLGWRKARNWLVRQAEIIRRELGS